MTSFRDLRASDVASTFGAAPAPSVDPEEEQPPDNPEMHPQVAAVWQSNGLPLPVPRGAPAAVRVSVYMPTALDELRASAKRLRMSASMLVVAAMAEHLDRITTAVLAGEWPGAPTPVSEPSTPPTPRRQWDIQLTADEVARLDAGVRLTNHVLAGRTGLIQALLESYRQPH